MSARKVRVTFMQSAEIRLDPSTARVKIPIGKVTERNAHQPLKTNVKLKKITVTKNHKSARTQKAVLNVTVKVS